MLFLPWNLFGTFISVLYAVLCCAVLCCAVPNMAVFLVPWFRASWYVAEVMYINNNNYYYYHYYYLITLLSVSLMWNLHLSQIVGEVRLSQVKEINPTPKVKVPVLGITCLLLLLLLVVVVVVVAVVVVVCCYLIMHYLRTGSGYAHWPHATSECRSVAMFISVNSKFFMHGA
jgi:hypothetical protein